MSLKPTLLLFATLVLMIIAFALGAKGQTTDSVIWKAVSSLYYAQDPDFATLTDVEKVGFLGLALVDIYIKDTITTPLVFQVEIVSEDGKTENKAYAFITEELLKNTSSRWYRIALSLDGDFKPAATNPVKVTRLTIISSQNALVSK